MSTKSHDQTGLENNSPTYLAVIGGGTEASSLAHREWQPPNNRCTNPVADVPSHCWRRWGLSRNARRDCILFEPGIILLGLDLHWVCQVLLLCHRSDEQRPSTRKIKEGRERPQ